MWEDVKKEWSSWQISAKADQAHPFATTGAYVCADTEWSLDLVLFQTN